MANKLELIPTNSRYDRLCRSALMEFAKSERSCVRISHAPTTKHSVVVTRINDIPTGLAGQHLIFTGDVEAALVGMRVAEWRHKPSPLHIVAHEKEPSQATIERLVSGYLAADSTPIIDALWCGEIFLVVSHRLEQLRVERAKLARWLGNHERELGAFEIDPDGSYVHWPHADVHFGWKQLRYLVDPAAVVAAEGRSARYRMRYGSAMRRVRESRGLRQTDLGLNERQIRRIEQGIQMPTAKSLEVIAKAHKMPADEYLELVAQALAV